MSNTLRLSDILARNVAMEWFEAVAIASEVAERVRESLGGQRIPELDQVEIADSGRVTLAGAMSTGEPVRRLGQLLQACLAQSEPPVQLRLTVSKATAPEPAFSSIRELAEALAYFERPDRAGVLAGLVVRALTVPAVSTGPAPALDTIAPLPLPDPKKKIEKSVRARALPRPAMAAAAAAVVLVAGASAYSQLRPDGSPSRDAATLALKASDAVGTTLVKGVSAVSETVGLGRFVPAAAPGPPPAVLIKKPSSSPSTRSLPRKPVALQPESLRIFDLSEQPAVGISPAGPLPLDPSTLAVEPGVDLSLETRVYSSIDPGITEPVGVRPQLPRVLPGDLRPDQLSQIELLILADGSVGSVKLLSERGGVLEGMLLSAAKAWKFLPATKDGRAVAYRKSVWLAVND